MNRLVTQTGALRAVWSLVMVAGAAVLVAALGFVYTSNVQRQADQRWHAQQVQADQRWCDLLATLDQPGQPTTTERGRVVQQQIHQLRAELGCGRP